MADGDFRAFAQLVERKWPGREVLGEVLDAVQAHRNEKWHNMENPHFDEGLLAKHIVAMLEVDGLTEAQSSVDQ
jgi:hypothetical protein